MKIHSLLLVGALGLATSMQAQAPQKFNYQGIARNTSGQPLANQALGLRISILDGTTAQYVETHNATTNNFGLYDVQIGGGTVVSGTMGAVTWASGTKNIKVAIDPDGGTSYVDMGTTQLLSVPYALHAATSAGGGGANINGDVNKLVKFTGTTAGGNSQIFDDGTKVGIGTITPGAKLEIKSTGNAISPQLRLMQNGGDGYARLHFQNSNTGAWVLAGNKGADAAASVFNVFHSANADGQIPGKDILRISGQGKVGVNSGAITTISTSDGMLQAQQVGVIDALTLYDASASNKWGFYASTNMSLYKNGNYCGVFNGTSGAYSATSDIRLKENIVPAGSVLNLLKEVQVMRYTYKADEAHRQQLGYIAQELEKQFPEFVNKPEVVEGKDVAYTVNYAGMSAVAIKGIQEQQEMIEAQAKTIATLQENMARLQQRLEQLER
ncbi:MAG TPA: tail fiber domain-containing protein [Flavobacteriales bacterium]|nr:tail fiber domain-containing protein [Flavobacteriales bacterium]